VISKLLVRIGQLSNVYADNAAVIPGPVNGEAQYLTVKRGENGVVIQGPIDWIAVLRNSRFHHVSLKNLRDNYRVYKDAFGDKAMALLSYLAKTSFPTGFVNAVGFGDYTNANPYPALNGKPVDLTNVELATFLADLIDNGFEPGTITTKMQYPYDTFNDATTLNGAVIFGKSGPARTDCIRTINGNDNPLDYIVDIYKNSKMKESLHVMAQYGIDPPFEIYIYRRNINVVASGMIRILKKGFCEKVEGFERVAVGDNPEATFHLINAYAVKGTCPIDTNAISMKLCVAAKEHLFGETAAFSKTDELLKNYDAKHAIKKYKQEDFLKVLVVPKGTELRNVLDFSMEVFNDRGDMHTFMPLSEKEDYDPWSLTTRVTYPIQLKEGSATYKNNCFCWQGPHDIWDSENNKWISKKGFGHFPDAYDGCSEDRYGKAQPEFYNNQ